MVPSRQPATGGSDVCPDGSHAQIRVVVIDGKSPIEAGEFEEDLAANCQTCSGDGGDVAGEVQPGPVWRAEASAAGVGAAISDADGNAAMLQRPGGIQQFRSHHSNLRPNGLDRKSTRLNSSHLGI